MAKKQPPEEPDEFGQKLEESIRANEALLAGLVYQAGQQALAAQEGSEEMPSAIELAAIKKLELQLENDKQFAQARKLTRRRAGKRR